VDAKETRKKIEEGCKGLTDYLTQLEARDAAQETVGKLQHEQAEDLQRREKELGVRESKMEQRLASKNETISQLKLAKKVVENQAAKSDAKLKEVRREKGELADRLGRINVAFPGLLEKLGIEQEKSSNGNKTEVPQTAASVPAKETGPRDTECAPVLLGVGPTEAGGCSPV
jgi:hypothetical protein